MEVDDIEFRFGVGGDNKKNSSSSLLKNWKYDSEERIWGSFYNLYDSKELFCDVPTLRGMLDYFDRL